MLANEKCNAWYEWTYVSILKTSQIVLRGTVVAEGSTLFDGHGRVCEGDRLQNAATCVVAGVER